MSFNFHNLDQVTRNYMEQEFNNDIQSNKLYLSNRLSDNGIRVYPSLLLEAITNGNVSIFRDSLIQNIVFHETFQRKKPKGGFTEVKMPVDAPDMLAEGEFNRFYIRALCLRAIDERKELRIYRAKNVVNPRTESENKIGMIITSADDLLNDLRENIGIDTAFGLPPGPNSGLSVELV